MEQKKQEYNQPAFPTMDDIQNVADFKTTDGMALLDYFAAKAIPEVGSKPKSIYDWLKWCLGKPYVASYPSHSDIAITAYQIAEKMMEERKKYLL